MEIVKGNFASKKKKVKFMKKNGCVRLDEDEETRDKNLNLCHSTGKKEKFFVFFTGSDNENFILKWENCFEIFMKDFT